MARGLAQPVDGVKEIVQEIIKENLPTSTYPSLHLPAHPSTHPPTLMPAHPPAGSNVPSFQAHDSQAWASAVSLMNTGLSPARVGREDSAVF